jgi:hypothetical protein
MDETNIASLHCFVFCTDSIIEVEGISTLTSNQNTSFYHQSSIVHSTTIRERNGACRPPLDLHTLSI